ncbi:MAG: ABC transporter permease [Armatimonadetes bacterium]|nr:ABC transporter permease [Anaerolineae bacterium]
MLYELAQLAVGNLLRARARLVMTSGGVLVGTAAVILLIALTIGLQTAAEAGIGQDASLTEIQVYPNYNYDPYASSEDSEPQEIPQLTPANIARFWQIEGVQAVIPVKNYQGGLEVTTADKLYGYMQVVGVDARLLPYLGLTLNRGELRLEPGEMLVGALAGDYFTDPKSESENWEPIKVDLLTEQAGLKITASKWGATLETKRLKPNIVGEIAPGTQFDYALILPIKDIIDLNVWISDVEFDPKTFIYDQVTVRATSRETTNQVSDALRELGFQTAGMGEFLNQLNGFFGTMRLMLGGVGGVALLVAAFGVANTMTMAILERTKEIGLMKAIGATDRDVMTVFLIEAGLVGLCGGAAGVGVAILLQNLANQAIANLPQGESGGISFLPIDPAQIGGNLFVIPPELGLFALCLATLVGISAGLYPALRAAKLPPVIALKSE